MYPVEIADCQGAGAAGARRGQGAEYVQRGFHDREFTILAGLAPVSGGPLYFLWTFTLAASSSGRRRLVILISGRGSNMRALVQACRQEVWPADIAAVISSKPDAGGLQWARDAGIPTASVYYKDFAGREAFDAALAREIDRYEPDYVILAGFMRVLTPGFVNRYAERLVNIHPSLLPAFPGLHTHAQALATGVQAHGCTVHFVTPLLDHGPIIAQGCVPVLAADNPETLADRVLQMEHRVFPAAVRWLAEGRVSLTADHRVQVQGNPARLYVWSADERDAAKK
jgi:phosphoribosylglycinamide formyltransferase-1